jgi:hypothetical protein
MSEKSKTIFRTMKDKENPFVMIDRRPLENPDLSWKAKGILSYLLSRPDNWTVQIGDLVKRSTDKAFAIRGAIRELIDAGHIYRREERDPKTGRFLRYVLEVYELPFTGSPLIGFPQAGFPQADNLTLNNTNINNTELKDGDKSPTLVELSDMPLEWQVLAGVGKVVAQDDTQARRKDAANLIAMSFGTNSRAAYDLAMAFQNERNLTFTESDIKGQRKAIKAMLEKQVQPNHVAQAVKELVSKRLTVVDLFGVLKTAVDMATKPDFEPEKIRLL